MRFPRSTKIFRGQLDVAPFAGVFFLLLIFLLLRSSFVFTPGVPIRLPDAVNLPGVAGSTAVVAVDDTGQIYFENQVCTEERLKEHLQAAVARVKEPLTLVVQADRNVKYEVLVRLGLLARAAGVRESLWATRPQVSPGGGPGRP